MPDIRREAGFLALLGVTLGVLGDALNGPGPQRTFSYLLGGGVFALGVVLWLVHYAVAGRRARRHTLAGRE